MATHLTPEEFVDAVEGGATRLGADRWRHIEACGECRETLVSLGGVLDQARDSDVPEPSPLYWEHLSRQLREQVDAEGDTVTRWWQELVPRWAPPWAGVGMMVAGALAFVVTGWIGWEQLANDPPGLAADTGGQVIATEREVIGDGAVDERGVAEPEWVLLLEMVDAVDWDEGDTDGLMLDHGMIDGVLFELSADERRAVADELETALRGASQL